MKNKTQGFTLAEILVAIVIGMISIAAAFSAYNYFSKSYASVSQKASISKSAREALSLIASDLRNTGYYHVDFESKNCMKWNANNMNQHLIGITHGDKRNQRAGKHKQADSFQAYYSKSAKDHKRIKYELKKYQDNSPDKGEYYLMRDVTLNFVGHDPSRGCPSWSRNYNMVADEILLVPYVEDFQIIPKDKDGNVIFPACTSCSNLENASGGQSKSIQNMPKVHTVDVYLTVRSPKETFKNDRKINIQNGESPYGSNITITGDKYHRETFFVSVHTRNLATPVVVSEQTGESISQTSSYNK